jgi:hypothetical protein
MPNPNSRSHHLSSRGAVARNLHYSLLFTLAVFVLAALVLGELFDTYDNLWWWDDMLHGLSGMILGLVGLLAIYFFNARHTMAISPTFVAVFVFCFAVTMGVVWEVYEFAFDYFFMGTMQQWDVSPDAIVMGHAYQGAGLRDTMSDLIVASAGAAVAAVISFFAYKLGRPTVLLVMRRTFPWIRRRSKTRS